jgi:hypothetical protein
MATAGVRERQRERGLVVLARCLSLHVILRAGGCHLVLLHSLGGLEAKSVGPGTDSRKVGASLAQIHVRGKCLKTRGEATGGAWFRTSLANAPTNGRQWRFRGRRISAHPGPLVLPETCPFIFEGTYKDALSSARGWFSTGTIESSHHPLQHPVARINRAVLGLFGASRPGMAAYWNFPVIVARLARLDVRASTD